MYPWPIGDFDYAMDEALDTAMNYLERSGQAEKFVEVQRVAAMAIATAWKMGERHRLRLANIKAVERKTAVFGARLNDEISGHRIHRRYRTRRLEVVRFGCGCGDHGPSGNQI
jgi:hypothetical protein